MSKLIDTMVHDVDEMTREMAAASLVKFALNCRANYYSMTQTTLIIDTVCQRSVHANLMELYTMMLDYLVESLTNSLTNSVLN